MTKLSGLTLLVNIAIAVCSFTTATAVHPNTEGNGRSLRRRKPAGKEQSVGSMDSGLEELENMRALTRCTDLPGFSTRIRNEVFDCQRIESERFCTISPGAQRSCCGCGGGNAFPTPDFGQEEEETTFPTSSPTPSPTNSPTGTPTAAPTRTKPTSSEVKSTCGIKNNVKNWVDNGRFGCSWYEEQGKTACKWYGHRFENDGFTANTACCFCGGGIETDDEVREAGQLSQAEKRIVLDEHNRYRSETALGRTSGQPMAANMHMLEWDEGLAANAAAIAAQCQTSTGSSGVTQSVSWGGSITNGMQRWFEKENQFDFDSNTCSSSNGNFCGLYTNMVSAATVKVGCGYVSNGCTRFNSMLVCQYKSLPGRSTHGTQPYVEARTFNEVASDCASNYVGNSHSGLCEKDPNHVDVCNGGDELVVKVTTGRVQGILGYDWTITDVDSNSNTPILQRTKDMTSSNTVYTERTCLSNSDGDHFKFRLESNKLYRNGNIASYEVSINGSIVLESDKGMSGRGWSWATFFRS